MGARWRLRGGRRFMNLAGGSQCLPHAPYLPERTPGATSEEHKTPRQERVQMGRLQQCPRRAHRCCRWLMPLIPQRVLKVLKAVRPPSIPEPERQRKRKRGVRSGSEADQNRSFYFDRTCRFTYVDVIILIIPITQHPNRLSTEPTMAITLIVSAPLHYYADGYIDIR